MKKLIYIVLFFISYSAYSQSSKGVIQSDTSKFVVTQYRLKLANKQTKKSVDSLGGLAVAISRLDTATILSSTKTSINLVNGKVVTALQNITGEANLRANADALLVPKTTTVNGKLLSTPVVLNADDLASGTTNKVYTAVEQGKLAAISGTNTGDQDLSGLQKNLKILNILDFGAPTDGVSDSRPALLAAISAAADGQPIEIPNGNFYFSDNIPLDATNKSILITSYGTMYFAPNKDGFILNSPNVYYRIKLDLRGVLVGGNTGTNLASFTGTGVNINNSTGADVYINNAQNWGTSLRVGTSGSTYVGCAYNTIKWNILNTSNYGILLENTGLSTNYTNQNNFYGGVVSAQRGIYFKPNSGQVDPFNGNIFIGVGVENCNVYGLLADFSESNFFYGIRLTQAENPGISVAANVISLSATCKYNEFQGLFNQADVIGDLGKFNSFNNKMVSNAGLMISPYFDARTGFSGFGGYSPNDKPYAKLELRDGPLNLRKTTNYGDTYSLTPFLYMGGGNQSSDGGVAKGYAFRTGVATSDGTSLMTISEHTGFNFNSDNFTVPTTNYTDLISFSNGKVIMPVGFQFTAGTPAAGKALISDATGNMSLQSLPSVTTNATTIGRNLLTADVVNNNATANTAQDISGLNFAVTAGNTYKFKFVINYSTAATTTGARFMVSGPASPTSLNYLSTFSNGTTALIAGYANAYDLPSASSANSAFTTGNTAIIEGVIIPSASGTVTARFASEVANSAVTAKAIVSYVEYQQIN